MCGSSTVRLPIIRFRRCWQHLSDEAVELHSADRGAARTGEDGLTEDALAAAHRRILVPMEGMVASRKASMAATLPLPSAVH